MVTATAEAEDGAAEIVVAVWEAIGSEEVAIGAADAGFDAALLAPARPSSESAAAATEAALRGARGAAAVVALPLDSHHTAPSTSGTPKAASTGQ